MKSKSTVAIPSIGIPQCQEISYQKTTSMGLGVNFVQRFQRLFVFLFFEAPSLCGNSPIRLSCGGPNLRCHCLLFRAIQGQQK